MIGRRWFWFLIPAVAAAILFLSWEWDAAARRTPARTPLGDQPRNGPKPGHNRRGTRGAGAQGDDGAPLHGQSDRVLRVRVLGVPNDAPIEGAELRVTNDELESRARTDAGGIADLPTDELGVVFVSVSKEGFLRAEATLVGGVDQTEVVLLPAPVLHGRVVSASDNKPLVGVRVWVGDLTESNGLGDPVTTDAHGRFRVPGVPIRTRYGIGVAAPGYSNRFQSGIALPASTEIVIRMGEGASLRGLVRNADGTTAIGARAMIHPAADSFLDRNPQQGLLGLDSLRRAARATTDSEGRFLIRGLAAGTYTLHVWGAGLASARVTPVAIKEGDASVEVDLERSTGIGVRVKGARGHPMQKVRITLTDSDGEWMYGPRIPYFTASDGTAVLGPLKPGGYTVHLSPPDRLPVQIEAQVEAGRVSWVECVPKPGRTLRGTVADETGRPLAGITIHYKVNPGPGVLSHQRYCDTDRHGRFRIEGLQAHPGILEVSDWAGRYVDWTRSGVAPGPTVSIVLRRSTSVAGRFEPPPPTRRMIYTIATERSHTSADELTLDAEGRFILHGVPSGVPVTIRFDSGDAVPVRRRLDVLANGEHRDLGTIALVTEGIFRGRVRDRTGRPYADMRIHVSDAEFGLDRVAITDADGRFVVRNLPRGPISVTFWTRMSSGTGRKIEDWTAKTVHEFEIPR